MPKLNGTYKVIISVLVSLIFGFIDLAATATPLINPPPLNCTNIVSIEGFSFKISKWRG